MPSRCPFSATFSVSSHQPATPELYPLSLHDALPIAPLPGEIEQLARALGEGIGAPALMQRDAQCRLLAFQEKSSARGDRGRGAYGDVARVADQPRNHAGTGVLCLVPTNSVQ